MRKKQKTVAAVMVTVLILNLSGCSKGSTAEDEKNVKYYTVDIDGERIAVPDDDERVDRINEMVKGFLEAAANKDYENPDVTTECDYYTEALRETYLSYNYPDITLNSMITYELKIELTSFDVTEIQFYRSNGTQAALVTCSYVSKLNNASKAYTDQIGFEVGSSFVRTMSIEYILEDGNWKIDDYSTGARQPLEES